MTSTQNKPELNLIKLLRGLRAIRDYTPEPIPEDALNDILEVGRWSGSASNQQPVELIVVRDPHTKQQITDNGVRSAAGCALAFVIVTPGDAARRDLEIFDDGRLAERLMLAAEAHGLGSCIGTLKGDGPEVMKRVLGVPPERRIWSVVTIGHTDWDARNARPQGPPPGRKPIAEFVHWDRYA